VWIEKYPLHFRSPQDLLDYLKTASLVPILSRIPSKKREAYLEELLQQLQGASEPALPLSMKRLFINAKKGHG
jgi:trans-aconitate methyltransferase